MGAETYQSQRCIVWFLVDQEQVGFEMALSVHGVLTSQGMIAVYVGESLIAGEQRKNREKICIKGCAVLSFGLALVVFFELADLNCLVWLLVRMEIGHQLLDCPKASDLAAIPGFHGGDGRSVGNTNSEGEGLVSFNPGEQKAHGIGHAQTHLAQGARGFNFEVVIDANVNHGSFSRHDFIVYQLRYKREFRCDGAFGAACGGVYGTNERSVDWLAAGGSQRTALPPAA